MNTIVVDLLSNTPPYNSALVNALVSAHLPVELAAISDRFDIGYYRRNRTPLLGGLIDLTARTGINNRFIRRSLKTIEYHLNLSLLMLKCIGSRPDIVHIMWLPFLQYIPFDLLFVRFLKRIGIKVVYTVHNILPHEPRKNSKKVYAAIYRLADGLICHTEASRVTLIDEFNIAEQKIKVIPHGPLTLNSSGEPSSEITPLLRSIERAKACVLQFGNIRPYKGLDFMLDVWKKVSERDNDCRFIITGRGDPAYINQLEARIDELGIRESVVTYFDYLSDVDLNHLIGVCDVLVYPYKEITQSGALYTGMAVGKAIVASNVGGFAERIRHGVNGLLAEYDDINGFSEVILDVIQDPEKRKKLGCAAKLDITGELSWNSIAKKTIALYNYLLNK